MTPIAQADGDLYELLIVPLDRVETYSPISPLLSG